MSCYSEDTRNSSCPAVNDIAEVWITAMVGLRIIQQLSGADNMSKEKDIIAGTGDKFLC